MRLLATGLNSKTLPEGELTLQTMREPRGSGTMKTQDDGRREEPVPNSSVKTFEETFKEIYDEAYELLCEKQARYGDSNIEQLGLHGVISRIGNDKIARARKFMQGKIVDGHVILDPLDEGTYESLADTLLDIANYALIAVALQRGLWGAPMERDLPGRPKK
jgi:hypothetical protein